jgi:hypothetical protein
MIKKSLGMAKLIIKSHQKSGTIPELMDEVIVQSRNKRAIEINLTKIYH